MSPRLWAGGTAAGLIVLVALASAFWSRTGTAAPSTSRELASGRQLYAVHCAVCHGDSGRGDGPSAAGFASKPSDLADGRLMNPLPDAFIVNIILRGGPAEGLSPGMPPFGAYLGAAQARDITAYLRSLATPAFRPEAARELVTVPGAPRQPIFFSHLIHAGSFQIDCQYCHADARRSKFAGLPSVERCMGCHKIVGAQDNPEIAKIREYASRGAPIPWVRVFSVPEFTYFPHKPHVRSGSPARPATGRSSRCGRWVAGPGRHCSTTSPIWSASSRPLRF